MSEDNPEHKVTPEQARIAAQWWASRLVDPKFQTLSKEERGDGRNLGAAMAEVLAGTFRRNPDATAIERFRAALERRLTGSTFYGGFGVDYGPDPELADALKEAGIDGGITTLPWKTMMWLRPDGSVQVSEGYGAEVVTIS